jgi:hypothetical protein
MNMVLTIPDRDRRRVISAVGLLTSDKDGEVCAAARAACRLLKPHGLTVADLIERALEPSPDPAPWPKAHRPAPWRSHFGAQPSNHRSLARMCLAAGGLNDWERQFLISIGRESELTPKQWSKLRAIEAKIELAS